MAQELLASLRATDNPSAGGHYGDSDYRRGDANNHSSKNTLIRRQSHLRQISTSTNGCGNYRYPPAPISTFFPMPIIAYCPLSILLLYHFPPNLSIFTSWRWVGAVTPPEP